MDVWIGLVEVIPLSESTVLGNGKGAFVNALALTSDPENYQEQVRSALQNLDLAPADFQDVEPFSERAASWELEEGLHELAQEVRLSGGVSFDDFHVYDNLDG
jgi:hypothetical protein